MRKVRRHGSRQLFQLRSTTLQRVSFPTPHPPMKTNSFLPATVTLAAFIHFNNAMALGAVNASYKPVLPVMETSSGQGAAEQSRTGRLLLQINDTDRETEPGPYGPREDYETFATTWGVLGGLTIITGVVFFLKDQWRKLRERVEKISETEKAKRASREELFRKLHNFRPGLLFAQGPGSLATVKPLSPVSHQDTSKGQQEKLLHQALTNEAKIRELFDAVTSGDEETVRNLIQSTPALVNMIDCEGNTVLHYVSANGLPTLAPFLLEHGADPELLNNEGLSALHIATIRDFHYLVELYLDWILNISSEDIAMLFYAAVRRDDGGALLNSLIRRGLCSVKRLNISACQGSRQLLVPGIQRISDSSTVMQNIALEEVCIEGLGLKTSVHGVRLLAHLQVICMPLKERVG